MILIICQIIWQIANLADWYLTDCQSGSFLKKSQHIDINLADCLLKKSGNWPLEIHLNIINDVVLVAVTPQQGKVDGAETAESLGAFQASLGCIEKQQKSIGHGLRKKNGALMETDNSTAWKQYRALEMCIRPKH